VISTSSILAAIQRSAHYARQRYPHDRTRRLKVFVAALSGAIGQPLIGDQATSELVFDLLTDTPTVTVWPPEPPKGK
jgi:hypothetical protein